MRCVVIGRHAVLERKRGEVVYLDDEHAARLIRAGHVEPAPEPPPTPPKPKRTRRRTVKPPDPPEAPEPRQDAGLSHVTGSAAAAEEPEE